jgi:aminopeptidase N
VPSTTDTTGTTGTTTTTTTGPDSVPPTTDRPTTTSEPDEPTPGDGLGDEPFTELGNPGVDVLHYDLALDWDQANRHLQGTVTLMIRPTEDRPEFTLDAAESLHVQAVTANGSAAEFSHEPPELRITPAGGLVTGQDIEVAVTYDTQPPLESEAIGLVSGGWYVNDTGSYVINEPDLARWWMPCDDHPSDKATWGFSINVPDGMIAVANGELLSEAGTEPWRWEMDQPMATYLVQVLIGPYDIVEGTGPDGLALVSAVLPDDREEVQPALDALGPKYGQLKKTLLASLHDLDAKRRTSTVEKIQVISL